MGAAYDTCSLKLLKHFKYIIMKNLSDLSAVIHTFRLCVVVVVVRRGTLKALSIICMCSISKDYILSIFLNAAVSL